MEKGIRVIAQYYEIGTGKTIEESILRDEKLSKAETLHELGYLHIEQIDFLQKIQDFKIRHQIVLNRVTSCPSCTKKTMKKGIFSSEFHAALTDHKVNVQRTICSCGWSSELSIKGIFGSSMHPDLLEKQVLQGGKESYEKSSRSLDAESASKRSINSHSQVYKSIKLGGEHLESVRSSPEYGVGQPPEIALCATIDGGHIKARGNNRSFEAMVATVYCPENIQYVNRNHNELTSKSSVASAKDDHQETMTLLFKRACASQGMTQKTTVTCLADGADNCWSIAQSIKDDCEKIVCILDWFHISMKFKNIAIPEEHCEFYEKIKWHLWHGDSEISLDKLEDLQKLISDNKTLLKLGKLATYIRNNKEGLVNYGARKREGLAYTSNIAEMTVNTLINDRQKGKQKMLWSREGAHNVLQIRSSVFSNTWKSDWKKVENKIYKKAA